jgi:transposase-like protein
MGATHISKAVKEKAIGLVLNEKQKVTEVAKQLKIEKASLYRWIAELKRKTSNGNGARSSQEPPVVAHVAPQPVPMLKAPSPTSLEVSSLSAENAQLRERLSVVEAERDHLIRTIGIMGRA